jgi:hypothetical protein
MFHFKCLACKTRLYSAVGADDMVCDLCRTRANTRRWVEDDGHFRAERVAS